MYKNLYRLRRMYKNLYKLYRLRRMYKNLYSPNRLRRTIYCRKRQRIRSCA